MSAKNTKPTATNNDLMETNKKLTAALRDAQAALESCGNAFGWIGALLRATDTDDVRAADLLALGRYVANDWESNAVSFYLDINGALNTEGVQ